MKRIYTYIYKLCDELGGVWQWDMTDESEAGDKVK